MARNDLDHQYLDYRLIKIQQSAESGCDRAPSNTLQFDTGETLLRSVLRVLNPERYRTLAWTSVKGVSKRKLVIGRKQGFNKRKCNSPIFDTFVCVRI